MASIALQHNDFVLIIIVVVKPAGPDDGVGMATRPDQTFGASFPVMNLSTLIPVLSRSVTPIVVIKLMRTGVSLNIRKGYVHRRNLSLWPQYASGHRNRE